MNLAETASIFAETLLADYLAKQPGASAADILGSAWSDAQYAAVFLLNVPARFAFEKEFYGRRCEGPLAPSALSTLMGETWKEYYGDALSEYDSGLWRSKPHFYKTGTSFYNFPYIFGYLFSLGVYAMAEGLGDDFIASYRGLLLDSGRMESEELAEKHLGADLKKPDFWKASISIIERKIARFESIVNRIRS